MNINFEDYNSLTYSEKICLGKIEAANTKILTMTLEELSDYCQVSTATINRTLKKIGYKNIKELKQNLSTDVTSDLSAYNQRLIEIINTNIRNISDDIKSSKHIYVIGFGTTSSLANDFVYHLRNLNVSAEALTDSDMLKYVSLVNTNQQLIIYFSYSGADLDMQKLAVACKHKIKQLLITCTTNSILSYSCDIHICSNTADIDGELISRTPLYIYQTKIIEQLQS